MTIAPGHPGIPPTWCSSDKDMVSTALGPSRLWATIGHGILNEVYWPSTGTPQVRDLGFIVAGPSGWYDVKRVAQYTFSLPAPYIPLATVVHHGADYELELEIVPDPFRDALLIRYRLDGDQFRLYTLLAPHLDPLEAGSTARVAEGLLTAVGGKAALCLAAEGGFDRCSAGYVGTSDGWQDFDRNGRMTWSYTEAGPGNVALMGELTRNAGVIALGIGSSPASASSIARAALAFGFAAGRDDFIKEWRAWGRALRLPRGPRNLRDAAMLSAAVIKMHEDRVHPGAVVASLSVPWGNTRNSLGGYHLVWTRDALEAGQALLAAGQTNDARGLLSYLAATQRADGHWPQNMTPDGTEFWHGIQLDEVGAPILLAAQLQEEDAIDGMSGIGYMVSRAASFLARHGPLSPQDRWEENSGASPFTLAIEIAALVAAAGWLEARDRDYALSLADCWNERVEDWTYASGTDLDQQFGTRGHYVRIGPAGHEGLHGRVQVLNREEGGDIPATLLVGQDFLHLVRLGLRAPDDPRITDSVRITDGLLATLTPCGVTYHRYNGDGYGENADGTPFDGAGIGRGWPLLSGERGHYALLAGEDPKPYLESMVCMTGRGGLMPEQVWDSDPIPQRFLYPGKPSGSAMPLVWTHSAFLQLYVARARGKPMEFLKSVNQRYHQRQPQAATWHWRAEVPFAALPQGRALVIEDRVPFMLHFGLDDWSNPENRTAEPLGLGMFGARFEMAELVGKERLLFTRRYGSEWEGKDWEIALSAQG
jgi:glucoamylase